jgi:photosystem II stability/assembly factor-like uncharacterized protein
MRPFLGALLVGAALAPAARAVDLRPFDDAALHAVQFLDRNEGWAVGDEGVVWHTIDGGKTWERQPSGVRASLRALHFVNPYTGWVVGRDELAHGGGSAGVLLYTKDGGLKWQRVTLNTMPGLHRVWFDATGKTGFVAGDGSEEYPTGLFRTDDGGGTWQPVPGPRCPGWLAADFQDGGNGALAGAWNRLAIVRQGKVFPADVDALGGRNLRDLRLAGKRGVAVGQGGLVLISEETGGQRWGYADLKLPADVRAALDFHGVACAGQHVWVVGRPGSVVLHSGDGGYQWETLRTGQALPLNGVCFQDASHGWAVGEFGTILGTTDGGKSWKVQRRGGQRAAALFVHARATGLPADTVALLGGEDGYLTTTLRVVGADPTSAEFGRAPEPQRLAAAMRHVGGAAGEMLWQFPLPQHLIRADKADLLRSWDRLHGDGRATQQLLRQMVLALRIWRPAVVVTDHPDVQVTHCAAEALVAEALHEAFQRAADARNFPEQIEQLGLEPWQASKLYGCWDRKKDAHVTLDLTEPKARLEATAQDYAAPAVGLLSDVPLMLPRQRWYRLLADQLKGAAEHPGLMDGIVLAPGGAGRRQLAEVKELRPEVKRAIQTCRNLRTLAETPAGSLTDPNKLLAQIGPSLEELPDQQAAPVAFAIASQYARAGQWTLAREAFLLMVDRYPAHPLSADAYRWLLRHGCSSEARRRHELGQFVVLTQVEFRGVESGKQSATPPTGAPGKPAGGITYQVKEPDGAVEVRRTRQLQVLSSSAEARQWYQSGLAIESRLRAFGRLYATDPSIQFCLQSARRNLGDFETARQWYADFATTHPDGPWRQAALAELWLVNRSGQPPRPVAYCRETMSRPYLDGELDDACWEAAKSVVLTQTSAVGREPLDANDAKATERFLKDYATSARLCFDKDFLYLAVQCRHPADRYVEPVKVRPRDADVRPYDRVSLLLDLDRDYGTAFQLQIDQRGCVCDDCWGELSWNPRWFVAIKSDPSGWQAEAAIPLAELTGDTVTAGRAWACNLVRVLPGRGIQAMAGPADVLPRPEGMGLLLFLQEPRPQTGPEAIAAPRTRVP